MKEFFKGLLKRENIKRILLYAVYMFLMLVLQDMVLTHIRPAGVCAFVLPTVAVAVGMYEGAVFGTLFSLVLGIFTDMFYVDTVVMYTVLFPAIAFLTGFVSQFFINRRFVSFLVTSVAAMLLTGAVQILKVSLTDSWSFTMVGTVILQTLWTIPVSLLAYFPAARWIE